MSANVENDFKAKLISAVKKEVKQLMEESVTRKFVHEESGSVTALCGAVESCLSQGLRRRALGLFKTSSTTALLHKVAKHCPEAAAISKKVQEIENVDPNRRSSSSSDSVTKPTLKKNVSLQSNPLPKYLWIRLALFEKQLAKIIDFLVSNAGRYYDKDSLVADPDYGNILSSLLVGPCALDYSRSKTPDHFWTDPPADELVQRHRISSAHSTPPTVRRPIINFRRSLKTSSEDSVANRTGSQHFAKDYVESLHQNSRATLLFGKNNVLVLPANANATKPMPGYLSLHQSANGLTIKWTPNQLMNGFTDEIQDKSVYWDYCLQVNMDEIVYVHCHQESESGGTIIFVGQDGVQRPPIHFPKGPHMLAFLSCIETGLLPRGRLDPPLWSQRSGATNLHNKRRRPLATLGETEEATKDYVFRIIDNSNHIALKRNQLMDTHTRLPSKVRVQLGSSSTSSEGSTKSFSLDQNAPDSPPSVCIRAVCDSMKRQIISRAFYGWLAYCRHLSTVRTHLSGLVNPNIVSGEGANEGLTFEKWLELCEDGVVKDYVEVYRLTYYGGMAHDLRKEVWPYLLGHYKFGSTEEERHQLSEETKQAYENTMSEWLAVEAIVRQRDKETQASAIAKLSSESISGDQVPNPIQRDLSNDVFEDISDYDYESPEEGDVMTRRNKKTKQNTIKYESEDEESGDKNKRPEEEGLTEPTSFVREETKQELEKRIQDLVIDQANARSEFFEIFSASRSLNEDDSGKAEYLEKTLKKDVSNSNGKDNKVETRGEISENGRKENKQETTQKEGCSKGNRKEGENIEETSIERENGVEESKDFLIDRSKHQEEANKVVRSSITECISKGIEYLILHVENLEMLENNNPNFLGEEGLRNQVLFSTMDGGHDTENREAELQESECSVEKTKLEIDLEEALAEEIKFETEFEQTQRDEDAIRRTDLEEMKASLEADMEPSMENLEKLSLERVNKETLCESQEKISDEAKEDANNAEEDSRKDLQEDLNKKNVEDSSMDTEYSSKDTECSSVYTDPSNKDTECKKLCGEYPGTLQQTTSASQYTEADEFAAAGGEMKDFIHNVIVTNASVDLSCHVVEAVLANNLDAVKEENSLDTLDCIESHGLASPARSACVSPASSNGGVYSTELLETFGLNLHRIEKDVQRCDRNYWYFTGENLDKLRNVMCTYVWEHLDIGYMQGMCDLVAPLLVIFNDESLTYACFCHLMQRMVENFPNGNAMDCHFANMRSLIQILDSEMYELMHSHGDYTHFYFCYRWFLLDFKRELVYPDVYATWEVIWAAQHVASGHFVLFLALALLETYRDIILSNTMDFTDIIKFFNEMAERHNASAVLTLARDLVLQLQLLIENK